MPPQIRFGKEVEEISPISRDPGLLFQYLSTLRPGDRTKEFKQRCVGLGMQGVPLLSEQRRRVIPERFDQTYARKGRK